jgi:hypothetical protein
MTTHDRVVDRQAAVRVTRSGPVLRFQVPVVPAWLAVPVMVLVVVVMASVAVVAVVS